MEMKPTNNVDYKKLAQEFIDSHDYGRSLETVVFTRDERSAILEFADWLSDQQDKDQQDK